VILEGESLFNDASALLIYRLAVGAAAAGALSSADVVPTLLFATVGSIVLGWTAAVVVRAVRRHRGPAGRIEFVDVERPGAPISMAR